MAKSLVRNRHAVNKMFALKSQLQAVSLRIAVRVVSVPHLNGSSRLSDVMSGFCLRYPGREWHLVSCMRELGALGSPPSQHHLIDVPSPSLWTPLHTFPIPQTLKSTHAMADAMKGATRAMGMMNKRMNLPALAKVKRAMARGGGAWFLWRQRALSVVEHTGKSPPHPPHPPSPHRFTDHAGV